MVPPVGDFDWTTPPDWLDKELGDKYHILGNVQNFPKVTRESNDLDVVTATTIQWWDGGEQIIMYNYKNELGDAGGIPKPISRLVSNLRGADDARSKPAVPYLTDHSIIETEPIGRCTTLPRVLVGNARSANCHHKE
jgi:hypothetical protein